MTDFQQTALQLAAEQQTPAWLAALREQGASTWAAAAWPGRKTEHWKYISLAPLQQYEQLSWGSEADDVALDAVEQVELDAIRLVFVNGRFNAARSSALPAGFAEALDAPKFRSYPESRFNSSSSSCCAGLVAGKRIASPHLQRTFFPAYFSCQA